MTSQTSHFNALWAESRTRLENQLDGITTADLAKKLGQSPNSVGFLLQHMAEVELLFAKNVFGASGIKITAHTVIDKRDTGEWTNLAALLTILKTSREALQHAINAQQEQDWEQEIVTKEFGTKTKAQALGRIVSHTAYHSGQLGLLLKYGTVTS